MNNQREGIYKMRHHALFGERISVDIANMMWVVCESIVNEFHENSDFEEFNLELIRAMSIESPVTEQEFLHGNTEELTERVFHEVLESYKRKDAFISGNAYPVIRDVYEHQSSVYENIVVPISDGTKTYHIVTNLKKAYETRGRELMKSFETSIMLLIIDDAWKEHLREMDDLKQSVQNAAYEQKDPLLIYKFEAYELFNQMLKKMNKDVVSILMKGNIPISDSSGVQKAQAPKRLDLSKYATSKSDADGISSGDHDTREPQKTQPIRVEKKVGRNDPCPCGSGKKFKNCHGVGE
jgi:preprotein translocase subunit SecA